MHSSTDNLQMDVSAWLIASSNAENALNILQRDSILRSMIKSDSKVIIHLDDSSSASGASSPGSFGCSSSSCDGKQMEAQSVGATTSRLPLSEGTVKDLSSLQKILIQANSILSQEAFGSLPSPPADGKCCACEATANVKFITARFPQA